MTGRTPRVGDELTITGTVRTVSQIAPAGHLRVTLDFDSGAPGAVVPAHLTWADDEALLWRVAQIDYDMHAGDGVGEFDDDWVTQAEQTLRALSAALAERQEATS